MIREFAVEPEALSRFNPVWQALEQFGVAHGRLISEYPKRWLRQVYEATAHCPHVERSKLEIRLAQLRRKVVRFRRNRPADPNLTWRQNAHTEDLATPFYAIVQSNNDEKHERVLSPYDLHDDNALWRVQTQDKVERTPAAIAAIIAPLAKISRHLLFVDPYFSTDAKWSKVFVECINACGVTVGNGQTIELHTGPSPARSFLEPEVKKWIVPRIPQGVAVRFVLWQQRDAGEKLHARYFLTERGGIRFDVGLDEGQPGETTDVGLLNDDLHQSRWADFQDATPAYEKVDEFTVTGMM